VSSSLLHPTEQFNALSEEQKKKVLSGGLGGNFLHSGLAFAIPLWWVVCYPDTSVRLRNGSAFFANLGEGIFAVTATHVFREYMAAKRQAVSIGCQLGTLLFDPGARLICCRDDLDIATFRVNAAEVEEIGAPVVTAGPPNWGSLNPAVGDFAFFAGFPAQTRGITADGDFATAPYFAMTPITSVTDHQIGCRFNRDKIIDFSGCGLPPQGYDIGGVSGGPMLVPTLVREGQIGGVVWRFAGVVVQSAAGDMFEQVVAIRAHYIRSNGQVG
jgi:hypothetical protein